jgi:hypothetical protein
LYFYHRSSSVSFCAWWSNVCDQGVGRIMRFLPLPVCPLIELFVRWGQGLITRLPVHEE